MISATDDPELDAIVRFWGHAYTFSHDPGEFPDQPHAAHRKDGQGTVRAAAPALLLDAIKDDANARPFTTTGRGMASPLATAPARPKAPGSPASLPARGSRQRPGPATPTATHALVLDPDDQAPRHARAAARASLARWGLAHLTDDVQAITSELVANAAAASRRAAAPGAAPARIVLWLTTQPAELIIRVWDPEPAAPPPPGPAGTGPDAESGRGLMIVDALSAWRDWDPGPNGGKHVRAALTLDSRPQRGHPMTSTRLPEGDDPGARARLMGESEPER